MATAALIIAIVSAAFAACAALIADKAQKEAQKHNELIHNHNKLSVVPYLVYDTSLASAPGLFVTVRNAGLGPAKITRFNVSFDGSPIEGANDGGEENVFNELRKRMKCFNWISFQPGESLIVGQESYLIEYLPPKMITKESQKEKDIFIECFKKLKFEIAYESFYLEEQEAAKWDGSTI